MGAFHSWRLGSHDVALTTRVGCLPHLDSSNSFACPSSTSHDPTAAQRPPSPPGFFIITLRGRLRVASGSRFLARRSPCSTISRFRLPQSSILRTLRCVALFSNQLTMAFLNNITQRFDNLGFGDSKRRSRSRVRSLQPCMLLHWTDAQAGQRGLRLPRARPGWPLPAQYVAAPPHPSYQPPSDSPSAAGWTPFFDQQHQRWYYVLGATGQTQWEASTAMTRPRLQWLLGPATTPEATAKAATAPPAVHPPATAAKGTQMQRRKRAAARAACSSARRADSRLEPSAARSSTTS